MINSDDVKKLAKLGRLKINDEEIPKLAKDMESILHYVSSLEKVDVSEAKTRDETLLNVMRNDIESHEADLFTKVIVKNMPASENNYLSVKKIL